MRRDGDAPIRSRASSIPSNRGKGIGCARRRVVPGDQPSWGRLPRRDAAIIAVVPPMIRAVLSCCATSEDDADPGRERGDHHHLIAGGDVRVRRCLSNIGLDAVIGRPKNKAWRPPVTTKYSAAMGHRRLAATSTCSPASQLQRAGESATNPQEHEKHSRTLKAADNRPAASSGLKGHSTVRAGGQTAASGPV